MSRQLNLILLGPPGAGKGTQAIRLKKDLRLPLISTGDILRTSVKEATQLGKAADRYMRAGKLVPDDLVSALTIERLEHADVRTGFILDGFPRTTTQAHALDNHLKQHGSGIAGALLLDVPDTEILKRIAGRRICSEAGHSYHLEYNPPKRAGRCDQDGSHLIQREDDEADVVDRRLSVYREQTTPLVGYYRELGLLSEIDGMASPEQVYKRIQAVVTK